MPKILQSFQPSNTLEYHTTIERLFCRHTDGWVALAERYIRFSNRNSTLVRWLTQTPDTRARYQACELIAALPEADGINYVE